MPNVQAPGARPAGEKGSLEEAIEALVIQYQHQVYGFALRLSGSREEAEEIAQDTFVRAYQALPRYSAERQATLVARPWLLQIALNVFRNRVRRRRLPTTPLDLTSDDAAPLQVEADAREQPEAAAVAAERRGELAARLLALPEHFQVAVILRHVEGLGYSEIATLLGQPVGTVKAHVHRGTLLLRAALAAELCEVS